MASVKNNEAALISAQEIADSIILKKYGGQHVWWQVLPLVCEAIQELALTSMPLVRHTQIVKKPEENWFELPKGFTDWVSVGIRIGDRWTPIGVSNRLMPYPNSECDGVQFNSSFDGSQYRRQGSWKSWLNRDCKWNNADFFSDDFFNDDFSDTQTTSVQPQPNDPYAVGGAPFGDFGMLYPFGMAYTLNTNDIGEPVQGVFSPFIRPDEVTFNVEKGIIMCPQLFPSNILYLAYVGLGGADSQTYIPIKAQAVIEAYVEWKMAQNRSDKKMGLQYANFYQKQYNNQHRLYRARNNDLTETVIRRIVDRGYIRDGYAYGNYGRFGGGQPQNTTVIYYSQQAITVFSGNNGETFVQSPSILGLAGKTIVYVIVGDTYKTSGYYLDGNMLVFIDGTEFYEATKVVIYYEI